MLGHFSYYGEKLLRAAVIFESREASGITRFLHAEFRHCFIAIVDQADIFVIDPVKSHTKTVVFRNIRIYEITNKLKNKDARILYGKISKNNSSSRMRDLKIFSCLEIVKSILCDSRDKILTPMRLFNFIHLKKKWIKI